MQEVRYTLPFPPSVNTLFRNLPKGGRVKTTRYKEWINKAAGIFDTQPHKRIHGDNLELNIMLYRPDKRKRDLDNYLKALLDFLVTTKVIDDDSCINWISIRWSEGKTEGGASVVQIRSYEASN